MTRRTDKGREQLWNPNAIGFWSLLFSPLFGSILTFMNWRALGKDKEAKKALVWILISMLVLVAFLAVVYFFVVYRSLFDFIPDAAAYICILTGVPRLAIVAIGAFMLVQPMVAFIFVWYLFLNRPQAKYLKIELNNQYIKKKWGKPLGLALGGLVGYLACVVIAIFIAIIGLYNIRAAFWYDWGNYDRAIANYSKAIEINPSDGPAYTARADAWSQKGYYDRAIADYNRALEIDPRDADAYNSKAWLLATCPNARYRNGAKAVELAQKALELDRSACWLDTLAAAYAEAGKFEDAIATEEKAIALHEKEGFTKNHIDKCIERLNYYNAHKPWREK